MVALRNGIHKRLGFAHHPEGGRLSVLARDRLLEAIKRLRIWESEIEDLEYPEGDQRRMKHDNELPPEWHTERQTMRETVVFNAALIGGETEEIADCYADQPLAADNPYNLDRVLLAVAIFGLKLPSYALSGLKLPDYAPEQAWSCGHTHNGSTIGVSRNLQRCVVCGIVREITPWSKP